MVLDLSRKGEDQFALPGVRRPKTAILSNIANVSIRKIG
jgi:hypothetical protein